MNPFQAFNSIFHIGTIEAWWPYNEHQIYIRFENKKEVVFTYKSDFEWRLETAEMFREQYRPIMRG